MKTVIIIIDLQKGFINKNNKNLPIKIKKHLTKNKYDFIIFSNFINKRGSNFLKTLNFRKMFSDKETEIVNDLKDFYKKSYKFKRNSYSVFKDEKILRFIKKNKIDKIYLCGL